MLFLFGGRVVPFVDPPQPAAQSNRCRTSAPGALTYGHRFLAMSGRPAARSRSERQRLQATARRALRPARARASTIAPRARARCACPPARWARRLVAAHPALLHEVPDLVEYPSVVAGVLPAGVPAAARRGADDDDDSPPALLPGAGRDAEVAAGVPRGDQHRGEQPQKIAINAERVLTARLRDARFFWDADRQRRSTLPRCAVLLGCRSPHAARGQAGAPRHAAVPQGARQLRRQGASASNGWRAGSSPRPSAGRRRRPTMPALPDAWPRPISRPTWSGSSPNSRA